SHLRILFLFFICRVAINDVQKMIDQSTVSNRKARKISLDSYDYTKYHPMGEVRNDMCTFHGKLISDKVWSLHFILMSYSLQGYSEKGETLANFWRSENSRSKYITIQFLDLVNITNVYIFLNLQIINKHRSDAVLQNVLRQVDIYVIPVLNVDGYIYTWTDERLWRKNRSPQGNGTCYGVDLNRNFDAQWSIGASTNCSSLIYCGPEKASELETKGLVDLVQPLRPNVLSYLTIHSYGQYILFSYGYKKNESEHHQELMDVANKAAAKILALHGKRYTIGSSSVVLYDTSGNSADWATDWANVKFSYTYELRDNGTHGFLLPEDQIKDTCDENTLAVMSMIEHINENYLESNAVTILSIWLNVIFSCAVGIYFSVSH
uniref:Peptidase M14 domain-containing protein n=1 Tax=Leptobrachium leishanense TaxID=445787 RepID=A0A8C5R2J8_9ANUR